MFTDSELPESMADYIEELRTAVVSPLSETERRKMNTAVAVPAELPNPWTASSSTTQTRSANSRDRRPGPGGFGTGSTFPRNVPQPSPARVLGFGVQPWNDNQIAHELLEDNIKHVRVGFQTWQDSKVGSIESSSHFYAHIGDLGRNAGDIVKRMNEIALFEMYGKAEPERTEADPMEDRDTRAPPFLAPAFCWEGRVVAARWDHDRYRAVVTGVPAEEQTLDSTFRVKFLDFGNEETCSCRNLRPLHRDFIGVPPIAIPCFLQDSHPSESSSVVVDEDTFTANVGRRFGTEMFCALYLTGESLDVGGETRYSVKLGEKAEDGSFKDVSKELLSEERPPSDPKELMDSSRTHVGCVVEVNVKIGRVVLGDPAPVVAFFDLETVFNGAKLGLSTQDLRSDVASGDTVEVMCKEVAPCIYHCSQMRFISGLRDEDFCDGHAVVVDALGQFATAQNGVQEKVLILPESLPHDDVLGKLSGFRSHPSASLGKSLKPVTFSQFFFPYRTLEVTVIPIPDFIKERYQAVLATTSRVYTPCSKLALKIRRFGEVKEGLGTVRNYLGNGFSVQSISDTLEPIWVPCGIVSGDREKFQVGQRVTYKVCSELPNRAYKWRAFHVTPHTPDTSSEPLTALESSLNPVVNELTPTDLNGSGGVDWGETEVKVLDEGPERVEEHPPPARDASPLLQVGHGGVDKHKTEQIDNGEGDSGGGAGSQSPLLAVRKPKTLEDLMSENLNSLALTGPVQESKGSQELRPRDVKAGVAEKADSTSPHGVQESSDGIGMQRRPSPDSGVSSDGNDGLNGLGEEERKRKLLDDIMGSGSESEKNSVRLIARQQPQMFRKLFACDPEKIPL